MTSTTTLPTTRIEAKAIGARHYFTGIACNHGHTAPRYVRNGVCTECNRLDAPKHQAKARAKAAAELAELRRKLDQIQAILGNARNSSR